MELYGQIIENKNIQVGYKYYMGEHVHKFKVRSIVEEITIYYFF